MAARCGAPRPLDIDGRAARAPRRRSRCSPSAVGAAPARGRLSGRRPRGPRPALRPLPTKPQLELARADTAGALDVPSACQHAGQAAEDVPPRPNPYATLAVAQSHGEIDQLPGEQLVNLAVALRDGK